MSPFEEAQTFIATMFEDGLIQRYHRVFDHLEFQRQPGIGPTPEPQHA